MIENIAHVLISPINQWLLGILIGAYLLKFTKLNHLIGKGIIILSTLWVLLCSQYFFSYLLIKPLERENPPIKVEDPSWQDADGIWVLACYHFEEDILPRVSQFNDCSVQRLVHAANMYRVKQVPIYLTGANFVESSPRMHSVVAAEFLSTLGVNKQDIIILNKGTNTKEEADAIKTSFNDKKLAVVSSATHGKRLMALMKIKNINSVFIPVDYDAVGVLNLKLNLPSSTSLVRAERAMYEYAALIRDAVSS